MPVSLEQRQAIIAALKEGLDTQDIAARVGVSRGTIAAVKAHVTMETYKEDVEEEVEVANAVDTAFGLERDLQRALREHIEQLEPGLTISDVIELKIGTADGDAIGQLLGYMGDLTDKGARVRGILIAREFASRAVSAARVISSLRLVRYGFRFTFETVTGSSS